MKMERVESVVKGRHVYYEIEVNDGDVLKCGLEHFNKGLAVTVEKSGRIAGHVPAHLQWGFREPILKGVKITCTILGDDYVQEPQFQKGKGVQQTCVYEYKILTPRVKEETEDTGEVQLQIKKEGNQSEQRFRPVKTSAGL